MAESDAEKKTFLLPTWVRDLGMKILPWAMMAVIGASASLYTDNIGNKRDISRETWRNDQQDARHNRFEAKQDRIEQNISRLHEQQDEFEAKVLHRLDALLEKRGRRER